MAASEPYTIDPSIHPVTLLVAMAAFPATPLSGSMTERVSGMEPLSVESPAGTVMLIGVTLSGKRQSDVMVDELTPCVDHPGETLGVRGVAYPRLPRY